MLSTLYHDHVRIQRQRTDAALAACGFEALAIYAGRAPMQFLDDQPYPFKVNPHFKLWLPLADAADCWLVYRPAETLRLIFLQPLDYWHKPPALPQDFWTRSFAVQVVHEAGEAQAHVAKLARCAFIGEWRPEFSDWGFADVNPDALLQRLHYERARKTAYELECMRRASALAVHGHNAAAQAFRAGMSEYEIHMRYVRATGLTEAQLPYPNIVALNGNAAVLHYQHQEREAPPRHYSFLIDAGAQFGGYAADVTRTYAASDDEFATLIGAMDAVQQRLCSQVRAGTDYVDIHLDAHLRIANLLREADVITMPATEAVETGLSGVFFPHGVGHLLGLQVHDVAGLSAGPAGTQKPPPAGHPYLRLTRKLEPGFVVTIEPGLYFIDLLLSAARAAPYGPRINWKRVEQFRPYGGIRIEDNVACTDGAPENLTRQAFVEARVANP